MRSLLLVVVHAGLVGLVAALVPARADACPAQLPVDPYSLFDQAAIVVEARVATPEAPPTRGRKAEPIELAVDRIYKGVPTKEGRRTGDQNGVPAKEGRRTGDQNGDPTLTSITTRDDGSSCAPEFRSNHRAIYFLDAKHDVIAGFQGYLEVDHDEWDAALSAWRDAKTDAEKLEVLVRGTEGKRTASAAAEKLLASVALYPAIDAKRRKRLVAAVADDWQPSYLFLVLARIRAPELPAILDAKVWSYEAAVRGMLERTTISALSDRAALAKIVGDRKRPALDRATALERCERLRGERLESFVRYLHQPDDVDWRALAAACRGR